jgi:hypothetical protein
MIRIIGDWDLRVDRLRRRDTEAIKVQEPVRQLLPPACHTGRPPAPAGPPGGGSGQHRRAGTHAERRYLTRRLAEVTGNDAVLRTVSTAPSAGAMTIKERDLP